MINKFKYSKAMTLAELMVVFFIIGVVAGCTIGITKSQMSYGNKVLAYASLKNLQTVAGELLARGCMAADTSNCATVKSLPLKGTTAYADIKDGGFCDRFADLINTVGTVTCDPTNTTISSGTTNFSAKIPNFIATNGSKYYNVVSTPARTCSGYADHNTCVDNSTTGYSAISGNYFAGAQAACEAKGSGSRLPMSSEYDYVEQVYNGTSVNSNIWFSDLVTSSPLTYQSLYCDINGGGCLHTTNLATDSNVKAACVRSIVEDYYTVYVDLDGNKGKSILNDDVVAFKIYTTGKVAPAVDSVLANNAKVLSASIKVGTSSWLMKSVSFRQAACVSGTITDESYCKAVTVNSISYPSYAQDTANCPLVNNTCSVVLNKP